MVWFTHEGRPNGMDTHRLHDIVLYCTLLQPIIFGWLFKHMFNPILNTLTHAIKQTFL